MSQKPRGGVLRARFPFPRKTMLFEAGNPSKGSPWTRTRPHEVASLFFTPCQLTFEGFLPTSSHQLPPFWSRGTRSIRFFQYFSFSSREKRGINCARIDGWRVFKGREWIFDRTFIFNVCSFNVLDLSWYINIGRNKYKGGIPFKRSEDVCQKNPSPPGNARNLLIGHVNEGNREFSYGLTNRVVASFDVEK